MAQPVMEMGTIHFMDGTKLSLRWPRQAGTGEAIVAANIRKALEADRILAEIDGALLVIPVHNIKYIKISPSPKTLPHGVFYGVEIVS
jgi:hypothetical protein